MEGDQKLNTSQININKLIKESRAQINELKKSLQNSNIQNTDEQAIITTVAYKNLQLLEQEKTRATNEQLGEIGKLQDEFNVINSTKESMAALRLLITTPQKPQYPEIPLGDEFTQPTAYINRVGPINKVKEQESSIIAGAFSSLLNKIGITDNNDSVA